MDVKICTSCNGEGTVEISDYRNEKETIECPKCKGTGRLLTRTYSYEVPFTNERSKIYEFDSKIIEMIRELQK